MTELNSSVPTSVADLIDRWKFIRDFARDTGFGYEACRKMIDRNWVTPAKWDKVIDACREKGVEGVNYEWFVSLAKSNEEKRSA